RLQPLFFVLNRRVGQDVTLECQAGDVTTEAAEWTRSDLRPPKDILFWRDGRSDPTHQHSSFTGRVQLVDGELKNGNMSLILKNVRREDVGTYECRCFSNCCMNQNQEQTNWTEVNLVKTAAGLTEVPGGRHRKKHLPPSDLIVTSVQRHAFNVDLCHLHFISVFQLQDHVFFTETHEEQIKGSRCSLCL
uniref:Ig-like domain-containing protein n=1 Tax=Sparus aurata TaxID=8175 RepID=A0A671U3Q4_SPAAU